MPYVKRDAAGEIVAVYGEVVEQGLEEIAADAPALSRFYEQIHATAADQWQHSDLSLSRVIEDLIDVLIDRKLIMFSDFPEGAQKKLLERRGLRKEFNYVEDLFIDEDSGGGYTPGDGEGFL